MKTLVVAEIGGKLVSLPSTDLTSPIVRGAVYFFGGQRFRVGEVLEYLGSHDLNGNPVSGDEKLLSILQDVYHNNVTVAAKLADLKSIGSDVPKDNRTSGGIIVPSKAAKLSFDNVIFITWDTGAVRLAIPAHSLTDIKVPMEPASVDEHGDGLQAAREAGYGGA